VRYKLHFPNQSATFQHWANEYVSAQSAAKQQEEKKAIAFGKQAAQRGYYTRSAFLHVCGWKSRRPDRFHRSNKTRFIRDVTAIALSTNSERLRIEILTILEGVKWPTASALLHLAFSNQYPIMDVNALWSLSIPVPREPQKYTFPYWWRYVQICRSLAAKHNLQMRTVDRALFQFGDVHRPR